MHLNIARTRLASFFFFNDTATTEIYPLSLHDALPISPVSAAGARFLVDVTPPPGLLPNNRTDYMSLAGSPYQDRKSTRLNSSHSQISYAVFCLKKKKTSLVKPAPSVLALDTSPTHVSS